MVNLKLNNIKKTVNFLVYRFKYLLSYIIIGFFSVFLEVVIVHYLTNLGVYAPIKIAFGFISGVFFSFILNSTINFKVPRSKNRRTFLIFVSISTLALILNLILIKIINGNVESNYTSSRFLTSAAVFMISYIAHRKITFNFTKEVGIAIYLNGKESIPEIFSKIKYYSDFIHIDLVDKSINTDSEEVDLSLIKEIAKTWVLKKQLHIMSKTPSKWIKKLHPYIGSAIFHLEIDEKVSDIISLCNSLNLKIGIAVTVESDLEDLKKYLDKVDYVQIMGIKKIGQSGQPFLPSSLEILKIVEDMKLKHTFEIIFDGGVKPTNISRINAKYIVAASGILTSDNPIKSFMNLKVSSRYDSFKEELRDDIFENLDYRFGSLDFIESVNIVGTFSESGSLKGVSDIDVVIILDELKKNKFDTVLSNFEAIKTHLESKYGFNVFINTTFGPLKFDFDSTIVFHVMIYDVKSHKHHCEKSPFTCLDWQRSRKYIKKPLDEIFKVKLLQPSFFFNSRRGSREYLEDIRNNIVSYRSYSFKNNRIIEEKHSKRMNERDRIEFSYHICNFLMINFLKLYYKTNRKPNFDSVLNNYFSIFPLNKSKHAPFIKKMRLYKKNRIFKEVPGIMYNLENFLVDFETQFRDYFYKKSKEMFFIRHAETPLNSPGYFIGQKLNPHIKKISLPNLKDLEKSISECTAFYSSPSLRCIETFNSVRKPTKLIKDSRLLEIDYGKLEGKDIRFLTSNYPHISNSWDFGEDPKFPDGENYGDVKRRLLSFIKSIQVSDAKKSAIFTHNVVIKVLVGICLEIAPKDWHKIMVPHLSVIKVILTENNKLFIELTDNQIKEILNKIK